MKITAVDAENAKCFDCGAEAPGFASVNNGAVICEFCADLHRTTLGGVYFSKIRNIKSDVWNEKHMKLMAEGGNSKLRQFLESFGLDKILNIQIKYKTKAIDFYRRVLEAEVTSKEFEDDLPTFDEGRTLLDGRKIDSEGRVIESDEIEIFDQLPAQKVE